MSMFSSQWIIACYQCNRVSGATETRQSPINFIYYYIHFVTMPAKSSLAAALQHGFRSVAKH